jgi:uncharacterized membrane protein YraQ (UPF0718 family)
LKKFQFQFYLIRFSKIYADVRLRERQASPGAAIAFWLENTVLNPARLVSSLPSLAMVYRSFRLQTLIFVAAAVVALGIAAGLLTVALRF